MGYVELYDIMMSCYKYACDQEEYIYVISEMIILMFKGMSKDECYA